jgi:hypothetical protein
MSQILARIRYTKHMQYRIHQPIIIAPQRHPKRWIIGGIIIIIAVGVTVKILTAPVRGHTVAVDQTPSKVHSVSAVPTPASTLNNQYFTLHLPLGYKLNSSQTATADSLMNAIIFKTSSFGTSIISIAVVKNPEGGWQNLSSYRARQQTPDNYAITNLTQAGDTLTVITRRDGEAGEVTAFWPHGGYVATVAASSDTQGTGDTDTNRANLQTLLANWQWH